MYDETENIRRDMLASGQAHKDLAVEIGKSGKTWNTAELAAEFEVIGFMAPFCVVIRKTDGVKGSMEFTHNPRVYFNFIADCK